MTTFGLIGAGHIGGQVARGFIAQGHRVVLSNSRGPETLAGLVAELGPWARAATAEEAAEEAEVAVVTVPLKNYRAAPAAALAGKIVIDTNNYYWERDGRIPEIEEGRATTSGLLQAHLPTSRVVKGFNHNGYRDILTDGLPTGSPERRALATATDHADALELITRVYDAFGFDTVNVGPLSESWRIERFQPAYKAGRQTSEELRANLPLAVRIPEQID